MAVTDKMELGRELFRTVTQINRQIEEVAVQATRSDIDVYRMRDPQGGWILPQLLSAKANCLHALAIINQRD